MALMSPQLIYDVTNYESVAFLFNCCILCLQCLWHPQKLWKIQKPLHLLYLCNDFLFSWTMWHNPQWPYDICNSNWWHPFFRFHTYAINTILGGSPSTIKHLWQHHLPSTFSESINEVEYEEFKDKMNDGILNSPSFGIPWNKTMKFKYMSCITISGLYQWPSRNMTQLCTCICHS